MPRVATTRWTPPEHTSGTQKGEKEGRQRMRPKGWETSVRVGGARRAWGRVKYCPRRDAGVCAWKRPKRRPGELALAPCLSPPPARSRHLPRHGGRTPHWWFRRKGRVCGAYLRKSAWQGMPKRATHRGEGRGEQAERTRKVRKEAGDAPCAQTWRGAEGRTLKER